VPIHLANDIAKDLGKDIRKDIAKSSTLKLVLVIYKNLLEKK